MRRQAGYILLWVLLGMALMSASMVSLVRIYVALPNLEGNPKNHHEHLLP